MGNKLWKCHTSVSVAIQMKFISTLRSGIDMTEHIHMRPRLVCAGESTGLLPACPLAFFCASVNRRRALVMVGPITRKLRALSAEPAGILRKGIA